MVRTTRFLPALAALACAQAGDGNGLAASDTTVVGDTKLEPVTPTETETSSTEPFSCEAIVPALDEGDPLGDGLATGDDLEACEERLHALVMPIDSRYELRLERWEGDSPARIELRDWNGTVLQAGFGLEAGDRVELPADFGGEHALWISSDDGHAAEYALEASCLEGCQTTTRYPIVLLHGMAGTDAFFDQLEYFYEVDQAYADIGQAVHVAAVDPFQPTPVRAEAWADHLDQLFASGEARRVNLIGHSQGGLDARYLATHLDPDERVASVTTIATPHRGSLVADLAWGLIDDVGLAQSLVDAAFDSIADLYGLSTDQDINAQLLQLTTSESAQFNADTRDRDDVAYYSWAGTSCQLLDLFCQADHGGEIIDPLLSATHAIMWVLEGSNDGLVSVHSSEWGVFRGVLDADHLDQVGLLPGTTAPAFDHHEFFIDEAAWLASQGL